MHRWLLLLMVALLPLRGWVGDAMAAEMMQQSLAAASRVAHDSAPPLHHMQPAAADHLAHDCMHEPAEAAHDSGASPEADCPQCASCQVCSSAALVWPSSTPKAAPFAAPRPLSLETRYASAERTLDFKPPIF